MKGLDQNKRNRTHSTVPTESIYIKFPEKPGAGGPATFLQNLQRYFESQGVSTANSPEESNLIFFPVRYYEPTLRKIRARGGVVVQRLDGVYYQSKHGNQIDELNKGMKRIYQRYADFVVFQSEFTRECCFRAFGERPQDEYTLIYNGADTSLYFPLDEPPKVEEDVPVRFITTGCFRTIDTLEPMIMALERVAQERRVELTVVGPVRQDYNDDFDPSYLLAKPFVRHIGETTRDEVAKLLRESQIYLYSNLNPPCPNAVIEAISTGIPVVGFSTGSLPELLRFSKGLLAPISGSGFHHCIEDVSIDSFQQCIEEAVRNYPLWVDIARKNSHSYDFETTGARYLDTLRRWSGVAPIRRSPFDRARLFFSR